MSSRSAQPPQAPEPPEPGDCCNSGCERCVYVIYEEQLEVYREALRRWEAEQEKKSSPKRKSGH